jgi:predicted phage tail protein
MASEAFVNESLMGFSGVAATAFFVAGAAAFFTSGVFAFFWTGLTAFFGAGFAAAFVALVVAMVSSSLVKGLARDLCLCVVADTDNTQRPKSSGWR